MKKLIYTILISCVLSVLFVSSVYAAPTNGEPAFIHNASNGTQITYDELCHMCTYVNELIGSHYDSAIDYTRYPTAKIVLNGGYYVIELYYGSSSTAYYLCPQNYSLTSYPGRYYSSYNTDNYIYNIYSKLTDLLNSINQIEQHLVYTTNNTTYTAGQSLYNIWAQLGASGTLAGKADQLINGNIAINSNITDIYNTLRGNMFVTGYVSYSDNTPYGNIAFSRLTADNICSYINANCIGKEVTYLSRGSSESNPNHSVNGNPNFRYYITYAQVNNGYITIGVKRVRISDGTLYYQTLYMITDTHLRYSITDDVTLYTLHNDLLSVVSAINSQSFNDTRIVNAIDRIYNWLDNADLATNSTIMQIVNSDGQDVNNSISFMTGIRSLFKAVFGIDYGNGVTNFDGAANYFSGLGVD